MNNLTKLEEVEQEIADEGIDLVNYPFHSKKIKGLTFVCKNKPTIGISNTIETSQEKLGILSEELSHCNITPSKDISCNMQEENRARFEGYNKIIGLKGLIKAHENGCRDLYEFADCLDVTNEYLIECINSYKNRYGEFKKENNYLIHFSPLFYIEKIKS